MVTWDDPAFHSTSSGFCDAALAWLADRLVSESWHSARLKGSNLELLHTAAAWPRPDCGSLSMTEPVRSTCRLFLYILYGGPANQLMGLSS